MPDLVWSGPEMPGLPARDTRQVYEELLGGPRDLFGLAPSRTSTVLVPWNTWHKGWTPSTTCE